MKKLVIGDELVRVVEATCDWCGEDGKCFESTQENMGTGININKLNYEKVSVNPDFDRVGGSFLSIGDWKYVSDEITWVWLFRGHLTELITREPLPKTHICKNCAKQLGK